MNRRVLLVDDQADFQEGIRQLLAPHFAVETANSGAEALMRVERNGPYAVVVSDYGMPGMTGIELLSELREQRPDTVRIMLTGCADLGLALEALEQGDIFRFLTKPPQTERLIDAVAAGVQRYRSIEEQRLFTEQLLFTQESLQGLIRTLEERLEREVERLEALGHLTEDVGTARSIEELLARTTSAVRELFGPRASEVTVQRSGSELEIVPAPSLRQDERRSLAVLSATARTALEGTRRHQRIQEGERTTLLALERLARNRDDETGEHLVRVSAYCRFLAAALREDGHHGDVISDVFVENIGHAAPLHDLGKVAIPDSILFKPGKLDEREWEVMRTHAAVGAEILRGVLQGSRADDLLGMAHDIAWTHHERWDGAGYPRKLAGEEIPLAGRIMALADCYDALTSERPYKHAWTHAAAVTYVREQRGSAFDPALVDAFLKRLDGIESILKSTAVTAAKV